LSTVTVVLKSPLATWPRKFWAFWTGRMNDHEVTKPRRRPRGARRSRGAHEIESVAIGERGRLPLLTHTLLLDADDQLDECLRPGERAGSRT